MAKRRNQQVVIQSRLSRLVGEKRVRTIDVARATGISRNVSSKLCYGGGPVRDGALTDQTLPNSNARLDGVRGTCLLAEPSPFPYTTEGSNAVPKARPEGSDYGRPNRRSTE